MKSILLLVVEMIISERFNDSGDGKKKTYLQQKTKVIDVHLKYLLIRLSLQ